MYQLVTSTKKNTILEFQQTNQELITEVSYTLDKLLKRKVNENAEKFNTISKNLTSLN